MSRRWSGDSDGRTVGMETTSKIVVSRVSLGPGLYHVTKSHGPRVDGGTDG